MPPSLVYAVLEIEPLASCMLESSLPIKLYPKPYCLCLVTDVRLLDFSVPTSVTKNAQV